MHTGQAFGLAQALQRLGQPRASHQLRPINILRCINRRFAIQRRTGYQAHGF